MTKREFRVICNNCGNEDVIVDDYETTKDTKFEFSVQGGIFFIECKGCHTELNW